jgi:hypothetical protein
VKQIELLGGPFDGGTRTLPPNESLPQTACFSRASGIWEHYVLGEDGRLHYAGVCGTRNNHDNFRHVAPPFCCCGRGGCDGSGPWPWPQML